MAIPSGIVFNNAPVHIGARIAAENTEGNGDKAPNAMFYAYFPLECAT